VGGKPEFAQHIQNNAEYTTWIASIDSNEVWINYYQASNTLIPVYEFIAHEVKQGQVKDYYDAYFASKKIDPEHMVTPVTGIWYITTQTNSSRPNADGQFVTGNPTSSSGGAYDLNAGAKGEYIYMWYEKKTTTTRSELIAEIRILRGTGATPAGWERVNRDLNQGAGGAYLYLIYRRAKDDDTRVIDFIGGYNSGESIDYNLPDRNWDWARTWDDSNVIADLNQGAGGHFIRLSVHYVDIP
jgi:hypothetical protein